MGGRKPRPTWLKLVAGVPGHRPLNLDEPIPVGDLAGPPPWFNPEQVAIWEEALKAAPQGLLKEIDCSVMITWVTARWLHQDAMMRLAKHGSAIRDSVTGKPMQSPYAAVARENAQIVLRAASEMGFSPTSRARVKVTSGPRVGNRFSDIKDLKTLDEE